ncbi:epoxide hydrolase family protein [Streptosporangium sp. KLBMP 9127]|nr:epoxide hydrolase [Streptosporangium sp. KLBMP 9127]
MDEITPFHLDIPQSDLDDLHDRLARTRWPDDLPGVGWAYGVPVGYLRELAAYWRNGYDWRAQEARINEFPQFTTQIDGQNIHFLHVRSQDPGAIPLIVTHGWPGSVVEFLDVIGPLSESFHLVIPSIPGFGLSGPTGEAGWNIDRVARAWAELMRRLGYDRYGAHGGDTGAVVSDTLGRIDSEHVIGVHVNGALGFPSGDPAELEGLTEAEQARVAGYSNQDGVGYAMIQSTRPQTLAYGLHDSPTGQLAWIVEKFKEWTDPAAALPEDAVDRDRLLTNVTLYWLTGTAGSSARLYREEAASWGKPAERSLVPCGVAVFPGDLGIRSIAEREHEIVHWSEFDRGGHFAAMEAPDLLVGDIQRFFLRFR